MEIEFLPVGDSPPPKQIHREGTDNPLYQEVKNALLRAPGQWAIVERSAVLHRGSSWSSGLGKAQYEVRCRRDGKTNKKGQPTYTVYARRKPLDVVTVKTQDAGS